MAKRGKFKPDTRDNKSRSDDNRTNSGNYNQKVNRRKTEKTSKSKKSWSEKGKKVGKRFELNVPDASINKADIKVLTSNNAANNDINWYNKLKAIWEQAARIPFNQVAGLPFETVEPDQDLITGAVTSRSITGIMTIKLAPVIGPCLSNQDAANIAAQQLYVAVTQKNNRDGKYDMTDLMMMVIAMSSAYSLYQFADRAFRGFKNPSSSNRYYPNALLRAMQIDVTDVQANLGDLQSTLNYYAYRLASINVPSQFDYLARESWLYSHVYKDADTEKAQAFMYMPDGFYKWVEGSGDTANYLEYVTFENLFGLTSDSPLITFSRFSTAFESLLSPILGSSNIGLMSSDIAMAFSDSQMVKISEITSNTGLDPVYDETVLQQIQNLTIVPSLVDNTLNITQNLSNLTSGPYLYQDIQYTYNPLFNAHLAGVKRYLNLRGEADLDAITEATRLVSVGKKMSSGNNYHITGCGAEIVTGVNLWQLLYDGNSNLIRVNTTVLSQSFVMQTGDDPSTVTVNKTYLNNQIMLSAFDWAPTIYVFNQTDSTTGAATFEGVIQELDNVVFVSEKQIRMLSDACKMSLFKMDESSSGFSD